MTITALQLPHTGAIFSEDRTRRYWLGRKIEGIDSPRRLCICAVQPSDADETANDPTILRELVFGARWGFGWLDKVNLFSRHSPDPKTLYADADPVGADNDDYVFAAMARADLRLCAWGNHGAHLARGARMKRLLQERGYTLYALGLSVGGPPILTRDGYPIHPLARGKMRVPDSAVPVVWP